MLVLIRGAVKQFLPLYFDSAQELFVQKDCCRLKREAGEAGSLPYIDLILTWPGDQRRLSILLTL